MLLLTYKNYFREELHGKSDGKDEDQKYIP